MISTTNSLTKKLHALRLPGHSLVSEATPDKANTISAEHSEIPYCCPVTWKMGRSSIRVGGYFMK